MANRRVADQREAIDALLTRSGRDAVPLRRSFLQTRGTGAKTGGPLAAFGKREVALDLYLLAHAVVSRSPWDVALPARVWARLVGVTEEQSGRTLVSRQWAWLEQQRLIRSSRAGRDRRVILLREDGSGRAYTHPGQPSEREPPEGDYFQLPHMFWHGGFDQRLSMTGKIVLLIALSLRDNFILPVEHAADWYSLSPTRLHTGLSELRALGLLDMRIERRSAPLTERGVTFDRHYQLRAPFRGGIDGSPQPAHQDLLRRLVDLELPEGAWFEHRDSRIFPLRAQSNSVAGSRDQLRLLRQLGLLEFDRSKPPRFVFRLTPAAFD